MCGARSCVCGVLLVASGVCEVRVCVCVCVYEGYMVSLATGWGEGQEAAATWLWWAGKENIPGL